jgi:hypothetical protein
VPSSPAFRVPRIACAAAVAVAAGLAVGLLVFAGPIANSIPAHLLTFYAVTSAAYAALPFVRRGDVLMGGMWLVLAGGVGPCVVGREISAPQMFADMAGVLMAAVPIYVARLRQLAQGDMREAPRRRQTEREAPAEQPA